MGHLGEGAGSTGFGGFEDWMKGPWVGQQQWKPVGWIGPWCGCGPGGYPGWLGHGKRVRGSGIEPPGSHELGALGGNMGSRNLLKRTSGWAGPLTHGGRHEEWPKRVEVGLVGRNCMVLMWSPPNNRGFISGYWG